MFWALTSDNPVSIEEAIDYEALGVVVALLFSPIASLHVSIQSFAIQTFANFLFYFLFIIF